ncbi:MAG: AraC family transcriptional regulator [Chthoniobacteraceae bacterium]|nr:AraC family transcriptional regulator [Chthoniobacteraceae bacterium]
MLEKPQITHIANRLTAIIRLTIPREEIQQVMGEGVSELMATIASQNITPTGPWFTHHLKFEPGIFDFEISVPVSAPVVSAGRVRPSQWPAMKVAQAVYHGEYEGLGQAWSELDEWILAQGETPAEDLWECYVISPKSNADPATWRTELNRPLIG